MSTYNFYKIIVTYVKLKPLKRRAKLVSYGLQTKYTMSVKNNKATIKQTYALVPHIKST